MTIDYRAEVAKYYDLHSNPYDDVSFYIQQLRHDAERVLELGCGTGRILVPLVERCGFIQGVDISEAMLAICRDKLDAAGLSTKKAAVQAGDICDFSLRETFDLIIAPFRVFQCLTSEKQIAGFFECVRRHLAPGGRCILNVFRTLHGPDEMATLWSDETEHLLREIPCDGGKITLSEVRNKFRRQPLTIYPSQMIRRFEGENVVDEAFFEITLRCYYPDEFGQLIADHGLTVTNRWGGYDGEEYGQGNELVVEFTG